MKKRIFNLVLVLVTAYLAVTFFTMNTQKQNEQNDLAVLAKIAIAQAETGTGDCGSGYAYICGYYNGIPYFPAYEGPWLA